MGPHTRVDKIVWVRERVEDAAAVSLVRSHADVDRARDLVTSAAEAACADARTPGRVELWILGEDSHRRAIHALHAAEAQLRRASSAEEAARRDHAEARRDTRAVRRVQERRRAEIRAYLLQRERRAFDELATLRFNAQR